MTIRMFGFFMTGGGVMNVRVFHDWRRRPAPGARLGEDRSIAGASCAHKRACGEPLQEYAATHLLMVLHLRLPFPRDHAPVHEPAPLTKLKYACCAAACAWLSGLPSVPVPINGRFSSLPINPVAGGVRPPITCLYCAMVFWVVALLL